MLTPFTVDGAFGERASDSPICTIYSQSVRWLHDMDTFQITGPLPLIDRFLSQMVRSDLVFDSSLNLLNKQLALENDLKPIRHQPK